MTDKQRQHRFGAYIAGVIFILSGTYSLFTAEISMRGYSIQGPNAQIAGAISIFLGFAILLGKKRK